MNAALQSLLSRAQYRLEFAAETNQLDSEPNSLIAGLAEAVHQAVAVEIERQRDCTRARQMFAALPERQRDAAILAAKGYTDKEICSALACTSPAAARVMRRRAMDKLGTESTQMLAVLAYKAGLICNHDD